MCNHILCHLCSLSVSECVRIIDIDNIVLFFSSYPARFWLEWSIDKHKIESKYMRLPLVHLSVLLFMTAQLSATTTLHCPHNQTLTCTAQSYDLTQYGDAYLMKDGVKYSAGLAHIVNGLNSCNVGTITRKWQAEDENWNLLECTQVLTFRPGTFNITNIEWPEGELHVFGCDSEIIPDSLPFEFQKPKFDYVTCSQIATSYTDREINFGPDCRKILREWTVVDWCSFNPGTNRGIWTYTQVFKLSNTVDPILSCAKDIIVAAQDCDSSYVSLTDVSVEGEPCYGDYVIINDSPYADTTSYDASGRYPIGKTYFDYILDYACGSKLSCRTCVTVTEDTPPVPYCLATLNVVLMPIDTDLDGQIDNGMVEVWAKDLNVNSYHPCHTGPLTFSFSSDTEETFRTFTCDEVGRNTIEMWVTDQAGRQAYCKVDINVQNNAGNIPNCEAQVGTIMATGIVTDAQGQAIENVMVTYQDLSPMDISTDGSNNMGQYMNRMYTNSSGTYENHEVMENRDFRVHAFKVGDIATVDLEDLAIFEEHIKGSRTFTNPYSYIAADINEDGQVSIEDFHLLKNLIGQPEEAWPNQRQRILLSKTAVDGMTLMPMGVDLPVYQVVEKMNTHNGKVDFISILKGDLDYLERL